MPAQISQSVSSRDGTLRVDGTGRVRTVRRWAAEIDGELVGTYPTRAAALAAEREAAGRAEDAAIAAQYTRSWDGRVR